MISILSYSEVLVGGLREQDCCEKLLRLNLTVYISWSSYLNRPISLFFVLPSDVVDEVGSNPCIFVASTGVCILPEFWRVKRIVTI